METKEEKKPKESRFVQVIKNVRTAKTVIKNQITFVREADKFALDEIFQDLEESVLLSMQRHTAKHLKELNEALK